MRSYSAIDMLRYARFSKENEHLNPMDRLRAYNEKYPELSSKEKLINLAKAMRIKPLYRTLTGEDLPPEVE